MDAGHVRVSQKEQTRNTSQFRGLLPGLLRAVRGLTPHRGPLSSESGTYKTVKASFLQLHPKPWTYPLLNPNARTSFGRGRTAMETEASE